MTDATPLSAVLAGAPADERDARLSDGADDLVAARSGGFLVGNERVLLVVAASLVTIGLSLILLGWAGAAGTTILEEQVPYLISGGLLGVAVSVIGALCLFTHWLTVLIRENRGFEAVRRQEHDELMALLRQALERDALAGPVGAGPTHDGREVSGGRSRGTRDARPVRGAARGR